MEGGEGTGDGGGDGGGIGRFKRRRNKGKGWMEGKEERKGRGEEREEDGIHVKC